MYDVCYPDTFFEEAYRVPSDSFTEVSDEANQTLSEAGCSLIFTPNDYYNSKNFPIIID